MLDEVIKCGVADREEVVAKRISLVLVHVLSQRIEKETG
jgi:hypothetical protein